MLKTIKLPIQQMDLALPLMKAIENRRSIRKWKSEPLSIQELSNLLWVACGITKKETKTSKSKRTSPSTCNSQEIKVYVTLASGLFLYDEKEHQLIQIHSQDIRENIGTQKMMHSAPVGLIYVSDYSKMTNFLFKNDEERWFMSAADTGFISQNVYLYCAATKLTTVVLGLINRDKLKNAMHLTDNEKVVFTQIVGKSLDD